MTGGLGRGEKSSTWECMKNLKTTIFVGLFILLCWQLMLTVHELGHCLAAILSGGSVTKIVLDPLSISRVDVSPNPHPLFVVWAGPIIGSIVPLVCWKLVPERKKFLKSCFSFFAGFCCVANGAYLTFGPFFYIGDCGTMLILGSNRTIIVSYGLGILLLGFAIWHRLGSVKDLFQETEWCSTKRTSNLALFLVLAIGVGRFCFPA